MLMTSPKLKDSMFSSGIRCCNVQQSHLYPSLQHFKVLFVTRRLDRIHFFVLVNNYNDSAGNFLIYIRFLKWNSVEERTNPTTSNTAGFYLGAYVRFVYIISHATLPPNFAWRFFDSSRRMYSLHRGGSLKKKIYNR